LFRRGGGQFLFQFIPPLHGLLERRAQAQKFLVAMRLGIRQVFRALGQFLLQFVAFLDGCFRAGRGLGFRLARCFHQIQLTVGGGQFLLRFDQRLF
jgi:hypothetical protein